MGHVLPCFYDTPLSWFPSNSLIFLFSLCFLMTLSTPTVYVATHGLIIPDPALLSFLWALDHYLKLPSRHQHQKSQSPLRCKKCKSKWNFFSSKLFSLVVSCELKAPSIPLCDYELYDPASAWCLHLINHQFLSFLSSIGSVHCFASQCHLFTSPSSLFISYLLGFLVASNRNSLVNLSTKSFIDKSSGNSQNEARGLCWRQVNSQNCARKRLMCGYPCCHSWTVYNTASISNPGYPSAQPPQNIPCCCL